MKVYISHPISGHDKDEVKKRITHIAGVLAVTGHKPVLPMEIAAYPHSGECPPGKRNPGSEHTEACWMRGDLMELLKCDAILMTEGWESSHGARVELHVAAVCGIPVYHWKESIHRMRRMS